MADKARPTIWHIGGEDVRMRIPILQKMANMGFDVGAVGSEVSTPFDKAGISYHRYELDRGITPFKDKKSVAQLAQLFKEYSPDIVHAFDTKPAVLVPRAAQMGGVNGCVRTVTGMGYIFSSTSPFALALRPFYRSMQKKASSLSSFTVFQNEDDMEYFAATGLVEQTKSVLVRGSGVDLDLLHQQVASDTDIDQLRRELMLKDGIVITMVARLVHHKGVLEYLEAARKVSKKITNVNFVLVGPLAGEGHQAVPQKTIDSYGDCVNWLGARSDIPSILSLSDIFILPSYYREGLPRVLLEAGGMKLALVTTNMPGCRDVVTHGETGLLVPPRDSESIAQAIMVLIGSKEMRDEMGRKVKMKIEKNFTLDQVAGSYAELYRKALR